MTVFTGGLWTTSGKAISTIKFVALHQNQFPKRGEQSLARSVFRECARRAITSGRDPLWFLKGYPAAGSKAYLGRGVHPSQLNPKRSYNSDQIGDSREPQSAINNRQQNPA
jgi:hypothetical protein